MESVVSAPSETVAEDYTLAIRCVTDSLLTLQDTLKLLEKQNTDQAAVAASNDSQTDLKRPLNGFLIWANLQRIHLRKLQESAKIKTTIISKALGDKWRSMTQEDRRPFYEKAEGLRNDFKSKVSKLGLFERKKVISRKKCEMKGKGRTKGFREYVLVEQNDLKIRLRLAKRPVVISRNAVPAIPVIPSKEIVPVDETRDDNPSKLFDPSIYGEYFQNAPTLDDLVNIDEEIEESFQNFRSETNSPAVFIPESPDSGFLDGSPIPDCQEAKESVPEPTIYLGYRANQFNTVCDQYNVMMGLDAPLIMNHAQQPILCQAPPVPFVSDMNFYHAGGPYHYFRPEYQGSLMYPG